MIALIGETFEKGPIRCDCGKKNKSLADLKIHLKSHLKKKQINVKTRQEKAENDISKVVLPAEGTAAFAVMVALNRENLRLTKQELEKKAQAHTKVNLQMSGNGLDHFRTTWNQIESLVTSGLLRKVGTPVLYSLSPKGLRALGEATAKKTANLFREIPEKHKNHMNLSQDKVIRKIVGNGMCLYGCASFYFYNCEDLEKAKDLRRQAHRFIKETWKDLKQEDNLAGIFPAEFIVGGQVEKVTLGSVNEWIRFLQTDESLFAYTEFEVETQSLANFMNTTIKTFNYSRSYEYLNTYTPTLELAQRSPFYDNLGSSSRTMLIYHEVDSHFEIIVNRS